MTAWWASLSLPGARITSLHTSQVREQLISVFSDQPAGLLLHLDDVAAIDRDAMVSMRGQ
jgi:hypothetical protein